MRFKLWIWIRICFFLYPYDTICYAVSRKLSRFCKLGEHIGAVVRDISIDAQGLWFDSFLSNRTKCSQRLATAVTFLPNCATHALSRGKEPRH